MVGFRKWGLDPPKIPPIYDFENTIFGEVRKEKYYDDR